MVFRNFLIAFLGALSLIFTALGVRSLVDTSSSSATTQLDVSVASPRRALDLLSNVQADQSIRNEIEKTLSDTGKNCAVVYNNGRVVVNKNPTSGLVPASTIKLLTAKAALEILGSETRFETKVVADSKIKNGVVNGPIYLMGDGDPLLSTIDYLDSSQKPRDSYTFLESLADSLVKAGVHEIRGGVIADDTKFDSQRAIPTWDVGYIQRSVVGSVGALSVNQGFEKTAKSKTVTAEPALHTAQVFVEMLHSRGITLGGSVSTGKTPDKVVPIASLKSQPVKEIVREMLTESNNTSAEVLLKNIGYQTKRSGTSSTGAQAVKDVLPTIGIPMNGVVLVDGSGLDRGNRVTCSALAAVLLKDGPDGDLSRGLAKAGETGTLKDRLIGSPAVGRLRAKTGTLGGVSGLAGWALPNQGDSIAFVVLNNGDNPDRSRLFEDRLAILLSSLTPSASSIAYAP